MNFLKKTLAFCLFVLLPFSLFAHDKLYIAIQYKDENNFQIKAQISIQNNKWVVISQNNYTKKTVALLRVIKNPNGELTNELLILSGEKYYKVEHDIKWKLTKQKNNIKVVANGASLESKLPLF